MGLVEGARFVLRVMTFICKKSKKKLTVDSTSERFHQIEISFVCFRVWFKPADGIRPDLLIEMMVLISAGPSFHEFFVCQLQDLIMQGNSERPWQYIVENCITFCCERAAHFGNQNFTRLFIWKERHK